MLLDTTILSELRRPKPERKVVAFIAAQLLDRLYVSPVTFAEIRFGIEILSDSSRRAGLHEMICLDKDINPHLPAFRVTQFDIDILIK